MVKIGSVYSTAQVEAGTGATGESSVVSVLSVSSSSSVVVHRRVRVSKQVVVLDDDGVRRAKRGDFIRTGKGGEFSRLCCCCCCCVGSVR